MSQGKMEINVGGVAFSGEGEQSWLAAQLEKVLKAATIMKTGPVTVDSAKLTKPENNAFNVSLAAYIKKKKGGGNQVDRFLITANWLRLRGTETITTLAVSRALKANHQTGLTNPADCLNQNVSKGFCEKNGKFFFITPEGLQKLGGES